MAMMSDLLPQVLMITGFVFVMMVVIEYLNVLTRGRWQELVSRLTWGQAALCAGFGVIPGCLGAFAVGSLYMHRIVTVGAAVAGMIATSGDEAFVMLAMFPLQALVLMACLVATGVVSGMLVDRLLQRRRTRVTEHLSRYQPSHPEEASCVPFSLAHLRRQWRNCTPHRGWLTLLLALFMLGVVTGGVGHHHLGCRRLRTDIFLQLKNVAQSVQDASLLPGQSLLKLFSGNDRQSTGLAEAFLPFVVLDRQAKGYHCAGLHVDQLRKIPCSVDITPLAALGQ